MFESAAVVPQHEWGARAAEDDSDGAEDAGGEVVGDEDERVAARRSSVRSKDEVRVSTHATSEPNRTMYTRVK